MCDHGNEQYPPEEEKRDEPVDGDLRLPAGQPLLVVQTQLRSLRKGVGGHGGRAGGHHRHDRSLLVLVSNCFPRWRDGARWAAYQMVLDNPLTKTSTSVIVAAEFGMPHMSMP